MPCEEYERTNKEDIIERKCSKCNNWIIEFNFLLHQEYCLGEE
jgi:hypothetical protein